MSGLLKGFLRIATFGYLGGDSSSTQPQTTEPEQSFNADYFFSSGRKIKNFSYNQLNETEQQIMDDIIDYINEQYDEDFDPSECVHIYLNNKLNTLDFRFKDCDELFHAIKDQNSWDAYDDDEFWHKFGGPTVIEDVYVPEN